MNNKLFGIGAIILGVAALIAAAGSVITNLMTTKWAVKMYEPFNRIMQKMEPLADKTIVYGNKMMDKCIDEFEEN